MHGKDIERHILLENLIYLIFWAIILLSPLASEFIRQTSPMPWSEILREWLMSVPLVILFLINNHILIHCLFLKKRYTLFIIFAVILVVGVSLLNPFMIEKTNPKTPPPFIAEMKDIPPPPPNTTVSPGLTDRSQMGRQHTKQQPSGPNISDRHDERPPRRPTFTIPFRATPFFNNMVIAILLVFFNLAIKLIFKSLGDEKRMKEMEQKKLETELEYLRFQINPHFFMNTLNNIHALIDIDSEKAKDSVIQLSKIMRYVLYDADSQFVPAGKAITFLENYLELMRIRYTDKVDIKVCISEDMPDIMIPPLIFMTFVENAFKYGISYDLPSFIHIDISYQPKDSQLCLKVFNSIHPQSAPLKGEGQAKSGIGIENARKRLQLLFNEHFTLEIDNNDNTFRVIMSIPANIS